MLQQRPQCSNDAVAVCLQRWYRSAIRRIRDHRLLLLLRILKLFVVEGRLRSIASGALQLTIARGPALASVWTDDSTKDDDFNCSTLNCCMAYEREVATINASQARRYTLLLSNDAVSLPQWRGGGGAEDKKPDHRQQSDTRTILLHQYIGTTNYSWLVNYGGAALSSSPNGSTLWAKEIQPLHGQSRDPTLAASESWPNADAETAPLPAAPSCRTATPLVEVAVAETAPRNLSQRHVTFHASAINGRMQKGICTTADVDTRCRDEDTDDEDEDAGTLNTIYLKSRRRREEEVYLAVLRACNVELDPRKRPGTTFNATTDIIRSPAASSDADHRCTSAGSSIVSNQMELVQCPILGMLDGESRNTTANTRSHDTNPTFLTNEDDDSDTTPVFCVVCELPGTLLRRAEVRAVDITGDAAFSCAGCGAPLHDTCAYASDGELIKPLVCCQSCARRTAK